MIGSIRSRVPWSPLFGRLLAVSLLAGLLPPVDLQPFDLLTALTPNRAYAQPSTVLSPDIVVSRTVTPSTTGAVLDNRVTVTYVVANRQATPITGVLLATTLRPGISITSAAPLPDRKAGELAWSLGTLAPFASATVQLTVTVPNPIPAQIDDGARAFATLNARAIGASTSAATLRSGAVDEALLRSTLDAETSDPFVLAKAAELGYDATRIFTFVRDEIGYHAYQGSLRGARGTLWNKAGNALDRASLLVALLRASGIPARYARGTLPDGLARQLIASMFPLALRTVALVPPGTQVADPVNDPKLLGEARDHFWVEFDAGGGFQAADPTFASAQIGQVLTTTTETFAEVPDELRHKVVVRLMRELTSQATALFGIPAQDLAPVIDQVVRTVEVVGRPLSIGHIVESTGIGAIFTAVTNTYSPYMIVGRNALDPSRDGIIRGQDYQEVLTNFPLGSQILTGLFLELDVVAPDGSTRHYRRTVADRIGIAARRHGGTGAATIDPQAPFLVSPFDITTINIMPSPFDPSVFRSVTAQMAVLQAAALDFQAQVAASSPGPAQTLLAPRANDVMRDALVAMGRARLIEFAALSDETSAGMARSTRVVAYFDSPRISIFQTRAQFSADGLLAFSFAIDLRKNDIRALAAPGQNAAVPISFNLIRGYTDTKFETLAVGTPPQVDGLETRTPLSAHRIFELVAAQGVETVVITAANVAQLDALQIPTDAKVLISDAVLQNRMALVPVRGFDIDGRQRVGWYESDLTTGDTIGVMDDGGHQSSVDSAATKAFETFLARANDFALGMMVGMQTNTFAKAIVFILGAALTGACDVGPDLVGFDTCRLLAWKNAVGFVRQFLEDSKKKVPPRTAFGAGYILGVTIGQNFSNDPPLSGYAFDPTPPLAPQPNVAGAEVPVAATATAGAIQGSVTSASTAVTGEMQASWSTTGASNFVARSMTIANGSVVDGNGAPVGAGAVTLDAPAGAGVDVTTQTIAVQGRGDLGFYAPATTDLGVGGRWDTYTATLSGATSLRVVTDRLAVNGTPLPPGTYTITTTAATLTGAGPSTSPSFAGTASVDLVTGVVSVGPGSGNLTAGGTPLPLTTGVTLGGFTGAIDVTAGVSTDTVAIDGTTEHVLRASASPAAVSANRTAPGNSTVTIVTSLADTYIVDVRAPDEWTVTVDASGVISVTPAAGLSSGVVPLSVTARSKSRPDLVAQADLVVTVGATAPAVIVRVDPDPLFTVPFGGAQVPSAFRAVIRNLGPTDTFDLTFPTVPAGFTILTSETRIQVPAGETAEVGVYLQPVGQLPPPGTPAAFSVQVTSTSNAALTASDTELFILPEVHGILVSVTPDSFGSPPGTPVFSTLELTAVGNVAEQIALAGSTPSGLTLQGLTSPVVLNPGQSVQQSLTVTPDGTVPLNSLLTAEVTASFGPLPFTEIVQVAVHVVVPSAQSAIDASIAAESAGQGAIADALRDLGLAITDLFGAPGDAVLRARVLSEIDQLIARLTDPAFADLVIQLQTVRAAVANGTPQSLAGDLAPLDGVLNEVGNVAASSGRHRFAARLEPNRQVASPQVPVSFQLSVQNLGSETTTYQLSVEGLPPSVTSQLSAPSVTLAPGEASANLGVTLTQTSPTALVAVGFNVRITPTPAPELSATVSGALTARTELVSVVNVTATPPFAPAGTTHTLSARLLNAVNQVRQAVIDFVVKDANGTIVHQASSPQFELGVLASLVTVDLGTLNTTGFANGTYTIDVTVKNAGGAAIPGASGTGSFMVGTPVTASITVTPEIVPAGTRTVTTTLTIDSQVPLSTQFAQIAQVAGPAHSVALKGTIAYFCGPNGIQIVDVTDPENPVVQGSFGAGDIVNSGLTACKVSGDHLVVRTQINGNITLELRVYSIANPTAPQLLSPTPATADYFFAVDLAVAGSIVLTPTQGFCFFFANHDVFEHHGDLAAFDISNPAAPTFAGVVFNGPIRNLSGCLARGGPNNNWQSVVADPTTLLMGSTTVQGTDAHVGVGRIRVVDIANPAQMSIVDAGELQIPGTVHLMSLAKAGTVGVALGSTGGWGDFQQDLGMTGNIVVATIDLTNPRQPALIATRELNRLARGLNRMEHVGGGLFIASSLGGVNDPPQVLLIDVSDPQNPIVTQADLPIETVIAAVDGDIVYGTSAAGFSIFRLGAVGIIPVTAQVQIPKGTGVTIVPNSFSDDPDEIVSGAQFDTLVWRRALVAGATSLTFTWQEQVANVQPGEVREVTLDTTVDFESAGTEGRIPLAPLGVLAEQVLALAPATRTVRPGEVASYTIVVKNPSTSVVDYTLTVEGVPDAWVEILSHVTIPAGSTQQLSLTLRTDPLAPLGEHGFAVNAHALGIDASVLGSVVLAGEPLGSGGDVRGVVVSLTPGQATAGQGTPATFTLRVTNVGSVEDTYSISVTAPDGFTTSATPASVTVPAGIGNFTEVQIAVTPPPGTPVGNVDISAQAGSITDPAAFAQASGVVNVTALGVTVALDPPTGPPGSAFQMTVTNTGAVAETFDLSLGGPAAVASTLGATSVVLAPGASQVVSVNVGPIGFATPGSLDLTGAATARTNTAVKASATARVTIGETAGIAATFDPGVIILPTPGGAAFLLQVRSIGNKEDSYKATIIGSSGPIVASLLDLAGLPTQSVPLVRIAGLSGASLVLNATLQAFGQGTVTVRVQSLTEQSVMAEATASVQSQSSNVPPIADAGPDQEVPLGTAVALDGTGSQDPDGAPQPLSFAWTFVTVPSGSALNDTGIDGAATALPSFEPDVRGDYVLRLTVSDGSAPAADEVLVRVVNTAPVAVAGRDRHVATATPATLDGSDSFDRDGDLITYEWSFESVPAGSGLTTASITGRTSADPSFVPDVAGAYVLKLVVRDQEAASEPSLVTVRAFAGNIPPIAHAGPDRHVAVNVSASLDGRASVDPDAGPAALSFAWSVVATPAGSQLTSGDLSGGDQAQASFIPDVAGDYRLALRVGDGAAFSDDEVIVTAQAGNVTPNADAGRNVVAVAGAAVTLDGSASTDPDGAPAPLTYRWRFVSLPAGSGLSNDQIVDDDLVQSRFTPDVIGSYVLELTVFDGAAVDFDNVLVVVGTPGLPLCFGRPATIFVRDGLIVGGPDHGKRFRGQLKGTAGDDVIVGTPGNDRIAGNGGNDVICGGDGDDVIDGGPGRDMVDGGPGNDNIRTHGGNDFVLGGDGNDIIETGDGDDEADGGAGDDRIKNQGGRDLLRGGDGNDTLEGGPGNDVIQGGPGRDVLKGQAGDDVIEGGPDDDRIDGGPGQDACADEGTTVKNCEG